LVEEVDKKLMVVLRDGRKLLGTLRSFDQFANIVLEGATERIYLEKTYGEKYMGLYLIRGENVVLVGEIDDEKEQQLANDVTSVKLTKIPYEEAKKAYQKEQQDQADQAKQKRKIMMDRGIAIDPFAMVNDLLYYE